MLFVAFYSWRVLEVAARLHSILDTSHGGFSSGEAGWQAAHPQVQAEMLVENFLFVIPRAKWRRYTRVEPILSA
jgi:hypothetical protein